MKHSPRLLRALPVAIIAFSLLATALQTVAYLVAYEAPQANYFANGSPLPVLATVCAAITCLVGIAFFVLIPKNHLQIPELPRRMSSIPAIFGFAAGAIVLILSTSGKLGLVTALFLLIAAYYAYRCAFSPAEKSAVTALTGFASVIGCILLDALYYFDTSLEMNAPVKVTVLIGLLCTMIYCTGELRILLGKAMPRLYLFLSTLVLGVGALAALPVPIAALAGAFNRSSSPANAAFLAQKLHHPEYIAGALIILGTAISAGIRLWTLTRTASTEASVPQPAEEQA